MGRLMDAEIELRRPPALIHTHRHLGNANLRRPAAAETRRTRECIRSNQEGCPHDEAAVESNVRGAEGGGCERVR